MNGTLLSQNLTVFHAVMVIALILVGFFLLTRRTTQSQFRVRESDRNSKNKTLSTERKQQQARQAEKAKLSLPRTFTDSREPHEILGISPHATEKQIQKAYRTLMKRYHPDKFSGLKPAQIEEYEKIAAQINEAKEEMLSRLA